MPIVTVDNKVARKVSFLPVWGRVLVYVYGANTLYVAGKKETLEMLGAGGAQQGIPFVNANGPQNFPWIGELWVLGSAAGTTADIEVPFLSAEI